MIFYNKVGKPTNILVNVNDYREKQREGLEKIAESFAQKIIQDGKKDNFPPFLPLSEKLFMNTSLKII